MSRSERNLWNEDLPELSEFLTNHVCELVDEYGQSYLHGMQEAWTSYGFAGISSQLLYIAGNLKPNSKKVEKELVKWSHRFDENHKDYMPISEEQWESYLDVQREGRYNMLAPQARELTGMCKDLYMFIIGNYGKAVEYYGKE